MSDRIAESRMFLAQAVTRSQAAESETCPIGHDTRQSLAGATRRLREAGCHEVADRIDTVLGAEVTTPHARKEMREAMQLLDVELAPSAVFETAGGVDR